MSRGYSDGPGCFGWGSIAVAFVLLAGLLQVGCATVRATVCEGLWKGATVRY